MDKMSIPNVIVHFLSNRKGIPNSASSTESAYDDHHNRVHRVDVAHQNRIQRVDITHSSRIQRINITHHSNSSLPMKRKQKEWPLVSNFCIFLSSCGRSKCLLIYLVANIFKKILQLIYRMIRFAHRYATM